MRKNKGEKIDVILVWYYAPGKNWTDTTVAFCDQYHYECHEDKTMELDMIVRTYTIDHDWIMDFSFECKDEDIHASIDPRDTTTSLIREIKGDQVRGLLGYIGWKAAHKYLIYIQGQCSEQDQIQLNSIMDDYPTIRVKSYKNQWNALIGIEKLVLKLGAPVDLGMPVYSYSSLPSTLSKMLHAIFGVPNDIAIKWAEYNEHKLNIWIRNMGQQDEMVWQLKQIRPDNLDGTPSAKYVQLYNLVNNGDEPGSVKMGKEVVADMLTPPEIAIESEPTVQIYGTIVSKAAKAISFQYKNGVKFWVPKSVIDEEDETYIIVKKWFWDKKRPEVEVEPKAPSRPKKKTTRAKAKSKEIVEIEVPPLIEIPTEDIQKYMRNVDDGDGVQQQQIATFFKVDVMDMVRLLKALQQDVLIYATGPGHWSSY